jgi:hypothetical protein
VNRLPQVRLTSTKKRKKMMQMNHVLNVTPPYYTQGWIGEVAAMNFALNVGYLGRREPVVQPAA